jgi:hypothetical protein
VLSVVRPFQLQVAETTGAADGSQLKKGPISKFLVHAVVNMIGAATAPIATAGKIRPVNNLNFFMVFLF